MYGHSRSQPINIHVPWVVNKVTIENTLVLRSINFIYHPRHMYVDRL